MTRWLCPVSKYRVLLPIRIPVIKGKSKHSDVSSFVTMLLLNRVSCLVTMLMEWMCGDITAMNVWWLKRSSSWISDLHFLSLCFIDWLRIAFPYVIDWHRISAPHLMLLIDFVLPFPMLFPKSIVCWFFHNRVPVPILSLSFSLSLLKVSADAQVLLTT